MADWAGRAVRRALAGHMQQASTSRISAAEPGSSSVLASAPAVHSSSETAGDGSPQNRHSVTFVLNEHVNTITSSDHENGNSNSLANSSSSTATLMSRFAPPALATHEERVQWERDEQVKARRSLAAAQRDTESLTAEMREEVMALLRAFDLPYLVAPFEAEAQCCVLEQLGLVDGVVTEDSDAFLFGAQAVYRHIFSDKKFVEVYLADDIARELGLSREDMVALAFFLGSDYCEGVTGVGMVNAMEILQAFPMAADRGGVIAGLGRFRDWLQGYDFVAEVRGRYTRVTDPAAAGEGGSGSQKRKRGVKAAEGADGDEGDEREVVDEDTERLVREYARLYVHFISLTCLFARSAGLPVEAPGGQGPLDRACLVPQREGGRGVPQPGSQQGCGAVQLGGAQHQPHQSVLRRDTGMDQD